MYKVFLSIFYTMWLANYYLNRDFKLEQMLQRYNQKLHNISMQQNIHVIIESTNTWSDFLMSKNKKNTHLWFMILVLCKISLKNNKATSIEFYISFIFISIVKKYEVKAVFVTCPL